MFERSWAIASCYNASCTYEGTVTDRDKSLICHVLAIKAKPCHSSSNDSFIRSAHHPLLKKLRESHGDSLARFYNIHRYEVRNKTSTYSDLCVFHVRAYVKRRP